MAWTGRVAALLILAILGVAPALSWRAHPAAIRGTTPPLPTSHVGSANGRTGIGVEVQVMHLRVELAWFESVPVSPGRRLVFSWLAGPSSGE